MNELNGRFWMVFNDSVTGMAPTWKHPTLEAARQEAERLATENPGIRFWVLEAQGFARIARPTVWTPAEDGMPQGFARIARPTVWTPAEDGMPF